MNLPYYLVVTDEVTYADSKHFRIRINPKYRDNEPLIVHEYEHIKQQYFFMATMLLTGVIAYFMGYTLAAIYFAIFSVTTKDLLYTFVRPVRYYFEVKAYAAQLKQLEYEHGSAVVHDNAMTFAEALTTGYNLNVTKGKAFKDIVTAYLDL